LQTVVTSVGQLMGSHAKDFRTWDEKAELPAEFIEELKAFGLFGLVIPEADGGLGFGAGAYSRALQEIAKYDASVAVTVGAHSSIGMRGLLLFGTEEQRARFYPKLSTGEMIAAFCLTEAGAGSEAAQAATGEQVRRCDGPHRDGDRRGHGAGRSRRRGEDRGGGDPRPEGVAVIGPTGAVRVMVATRPVDFRKGAAGLAALVREEMRSDPFSGTIYVFRARRADRVKLVFWDGTGVCLFAKRLEDGRFHWPAIEDGVIRLTAAQLSALLEGLDWRRVHEARETAAPAAAS
jgi:transposase